MVTPASIVLLLAASLARAPDLWANHVLPLFEGSRVPPVEEVQSVIVTGGSQNAIAAFGMEMFAVVIADIPTGTVAESIPGLQPSSFNPISVMTVPGTSWTGDRRANPMVLNLATDRVEQVVAKKTQFVDVSASTLHDQAIVPSDSGDCRNLPI